MSLAFYYYSEDNMNAPFFNTLPSFIVKFANSSRLSGGDNAYKLLYGCQRAVGDPQCPAMHQETFSLFRHNNEDIGIILNNRVSASMTKRQKYECGTCVTKNVLVATKCKCPIGNKVTGSKIVCIHNLPLVYAVTFLLYDGFAQHLLIEAANRWDEDIENLVKSTEKSELRKCIRALMRTAGIEEENIDTYYSFSSFSKMLSEFNVGTEKCKLKFHPKPTRNEVMPLRFMSFKSNHKTNKERILSTGGNILLESADGDADVLLSGQNNVNEKNGLNLKVKVECNGLATKSESDNAVNEVGHHVEDLYEIEESLWGTEKSEDNVYSLHSGNKEREKRKNRQRMYAPPLV